MTDRVCETTEVPEREVLIAYLSYVLDDLELMNETSAELVRMAIACLNDGASMVPPLADQDPLFS